MKCVRFFWLLCVVLPAYAGTAGGHVRITLHEEVELQSLRYRLKDIADIATGDAALLAGLSELTVGKAPRPGYIGYVTRHELAALIERQVPAAHNRLDWQGAAKTRIRTAGSMYPGVRIQQSAYDRLYEHLSERYSDFSIGTVEDNVASPVLPFGEVSVTPKLAGLTLNKRMAVWVDIHVDEVLYQTVPVWFSVSVYQEVLAAKRPMQRHDVPRESDFARIVADIAALQDKPVRSVEALEGMRLSRPLSEGGALLSSMLEIRPLVVRGQEVRVYASAGKVTLSTTAIALHDGDMLQKIGVKHPQRETRYFATVIGQGRVRVH